jgi:phage terminase large subunit-like protein
MPRSPGKGIERHDAKKYASTYAQRGVRDRQRAEILEPEEIKNRGLIRNASDEFAIERGVWDDGLGEYLPCRYCVYRAEHIVLTFKNNFRLWEGRFAGQRADPDRLKWAGDHLRDLFGWVYFDPRLNRWVRRFRRAAVWVAKKNGKSPIAAGVGLYLLKWDGESGQNVFSAARDLKQAAIVHRHARLTVNSFETEIRDQFSINNTTGEIRYPHTNSAYSTLSGENWKSREGINGSAIIDEIHVVDDRLMQVLEGLDAGRDEPLIYQISTAGKGADTYGRKEYDYGKLIERGQPGTKRKDVGYFFRCYEAPQDVDDSELVPDSDGSVSERALSIIKMANPSLGITVQTKEICDKLRRARRSETDWVNFKQRRLNIWQSSENPWFSDAGLWGKCGTKHSIESLACFGYTGGGIGLDLSRTRDMCSAVCVVGDDDKVRIVPHFWLPDKQFRQLVDQIPIREWQRDGWLTVIDGEVINFGVIEDWLVHAIGVLDTVILAFDPKFAQDICERIENRTSVHLLPFSQTHDSYAAPTQDFERLVYSGKLRHDRNPCMTWQVGNVLISERQGRRKPIKDDRYRWRTIDGVQAAIMGLSAFNESPKHRKGSVYDRRDPIII